MIKAWLILILALSQKPDVLDYQSITVNGINYKSSKEELLRVFGEPISSFDPEYECGAYSKEQDYVKTTTLYKYPGFDILLVNDKVTFERINFSELPDSLKIVSDQITITKKSTLEDFKSIFPSSYRNYPKSQSVFRLLACENCDDQLHIRFNYSGKIVSLEFWTRC